MKRIIIGTTIIIFGIALFLGIGYFFFMQGSLDGLLAKFGFNFNNNENTVLEQSPETGETEQNNNSNNSNNNIPVNTVRKKIIATGNNNQNNTEDNSEIIKTPTIVELNKEDLMRMAASFAERFGSYSNQSNFSNISDLKIFMSEKMKKWADDFVAEQRAKTNSTDIYFGLTTKAVGKELKSYDDDVGRATVLVHTRRREASITTGNTSNIYDQSIEIIFVKENGAWKVDNAFWQAD